MEGGHTLNCAHTMLTHQQGECLTGQWQSTCPIRTLAGSGWRLTSREMMPALRALLPRTKENSLTWASPAATIHLMYWLVFGKRRDKTRAARTNCESPVLLLSQSRGGQAPRTERTQMWGSPRITDRGDIQRGTSMLKAPNKHKMSEIKPHRTPRTNPGFRFLCRKQNLLPAPAPN